MKFKHKTKAQYHLGLVGGFLLSNILFLLKVQCGKYGPIGPRIAITLDQHYLSTKVANFL